MSRIQKPRQFAIALVTTALVLATGVACSKDKSNWNGEGAKGEDKAAVELTVTPAEGAADVPVSAEIGVGAAGGGEVTGVTLADASGAAVKGEMRADGTSWVPADPLKYTTQYKAVVDGRDAKGRTAQKTVSFTTMARPGNRMEAQVFMADNITTYGQAMPIVVEFKQGGVKKEQRAAVEKRLFVTSDPPQLGAWHWDSDIQVEYRPKEYWQPGTKLKVRLGLGGLPIGDGRYGQTDISINAGIDKVRRSIDVDNATKQLVATQDGQVVKQFPVSLGKTANPSMSGTMVIIERLEKTVFDSSTYGVPANSADGYRTDVQFAERLTWSGQFIHAAPWSVADQGKRNVSHGCVNVSLENAQWIYGWTRVGDPVTVKGTEEKQPNGDGWTAWNQTWDEFLKGSALPAPGATAPSGAPSPSSS